MTIREKFILRLAMIYMIANLDDVCEAFAKRTDDGELACELWGGDGYLIDLNGEEDFSPKEAECEQVMKLLQ